MKLVLTTVLAIFVVPLCFAKIVMATSPEASVHSEKSDEAKLQEDLQLKEALQAEENTFKVE